MLWTIAVILIVLWLLGLVTSYTMGGVHSHHAGDCHYRCGSRLHSGATRVVNKSFCSMKA